MIARNGRPAGSLAQEAAVLPADPLLARQGAAITEPGYSRRMIPAPPPPKHPPGTRLRVTQHVRVGHRRWLTWVEGVVVAEGRRPVGGIEMGGKASYCQQETLQLRRDDGEITEIAVDEETQIETIESPAP
jgi:hypothetical protein